MKRNLFALTLAAGLLPAVGAFAEGSVKLDVASTFPKNLKVVGEAAEFLADTLKANSGGAVVLTIHGAGDLVPALEVFNAVSTGAIEAAWDWPGYWSGTVPVSALAGAIPFGPNPETFVGWMMNGGGKEFIQRGYDPYNVKFLPCQILQPESGGWFNKEINTVDDLQGLRIRMGGLGGEILNKIGASAQLISAGEIYVSLERGRIDAAEYSQPIIDQALGFDEIAKRYYFPGWHQPSSFNSLIINMNVWNGFSDEVKAQFETSCAANLVATQTYGLNEQAAAIAKFEANGVVVGRFPDEVLDTLRVATKEVMGERASKDALFKEAYDSLNAYIAAADRWTTLQKIPVE